MFETHSDYEFNILTPSTEDNASEPTQLKFEFSYSPSAWP
jgi:hypothetical protein